MLLYALPAAGIVLSVAPLMGADPAIDASHKRWLHIHVRPPVRGLLKVRVLLLASLSCIATLPDLTAPLQLNQGHLLVSHGWDVDTCSDDSWAA